MSSEPPFDSASDVPPGGSPSPAHDPRYAAAGAYVRPQVVAPIAPPPRRRSGLGKLLIVVLVLMLGFSFLMNLGLLASLGGSAASRSPLQERHHSLSRWGRDKVAIIQVEGTIVDGRYVKQQIDRIRDDKQVKAVVLRVNSPGGTVTGADYLYHHLLKLREERVLPIVVSMGSVAASGGYYVAMCVGDTPDSIYAEPTTWCGSIGVVIPHYDLSGLLAEWKIRENSIQSHPLKSLGSFTKEMTPEERQVLQELVDAAFDRFKELIRLGRPQFRDDPAALDAVATGQVFTTGQALEHGLVDSEGFIEDAIDRAIDLAGLDKDRTRVVQYDAPLGLFSILSGAASPQPAALDTAALWNLATPRAYYLWTRVPALAHSSPH